MRKMAFSLAVAVLMTVGYAYGQDGMRPVQANRITIGIAPDALKNVSFQADRASFENGAMHLNGNVRITVDGHIMTGDAAVITTDDIVLEGHASVDQPFGR